MFSYFWPLILVIVSNTFYHVCSKSLPQDINPLVSLTVTYLIGAVCTGVLYFILNRDADLVKEFSKFNWAPFALGLVIVGLEVGTIYAYKAGWQIGTFSIVSSTVLSIVLIFVGLFLFREKLSWNKIVGIVICLAGIGFINIK